MHPLTLYQIDAFTQVPFAGNPAAVCLLDDVVDESWMQALAAEMNLSETAFLFRRQCEQPTAFDLRWFTPTVEVDLCGHATLAAAHLLWELEQLDAQEIARFHTRSGLLTARQVGDAGIELCFPVDSLTPLSEDPWVIDALGAEPIALYRGTSDLMAVFSCEAEVQALTPDMASLKGLQYRGIIATAQADGDDYDFVSRFFAPAAGIDEDPVTGSAHCTLAPYWARLLGRNELRAHQASARGGEVGVVLDGQQVRLSGHAVTVMRAEWLI